MRILVTNEHLDQRAGSDLFLRDLARGLQRLGHFVIAYSSDLRERQRLLERDTIAVATDLESLTFRPEIIHARHHLDAMSAVLALPGVPAIYHCLAPTWLLALPRHPRIHRYVAPSVALAERMSHEGKVPLESIEVVPNAVDLTRFSLVRVPAAKLRRGLIYDDSLRLDSAAVGEVRALVAALGIELDLVGRRLGNVVDRPETRLPSYDVVFASGRSAIEALACGCAVVLVGEMSVGPVVDEENLERLRKADFTVPGDSKLPSIAAIAEKIEGYSASASAAITQQIRDTSSLASLVDTFDDIYRRVTAFHASNPPDLDAEQKAASRYLSAVVPMIKQMELQKNVDMSITTMVAWLDASSRLAAVQRETDKPRW